MTHRSLGLNGPSVSPVGIGAMSFSDVYGATTETESHAVLDAALEMGITHIDTANIYGMGRSEEAIGTWLSSRGKATRDAVTIATKASIWRDPDSGARGFNNSRAHLEAELDASLKRLGTDHVELFYVHRRDPAVEVEEVAESLAALVASGKTQAIGFSEIAPSTLRRAAAIHPVAAVQSEYSLWTRLPDLGVLQACEDVGAAFVAFSPVGRGILTDRPPTPDRIAASGILKEQPRFIGQNYRANMDATDRFRALAADMGVPTASLAIAWALAQAKHVHAIPGTRSVEHLRELARGATLSLTDADLNQIETVLPVGFAAGDRYSDYQNIGPERYC